MEIPTSSYLSIASSSTSSSTIRATASAIRNTTSLSLPPSTLTIPFSPCYPSSPTLGPGFQRQQNTTRSSHGSSPRNGPRAIPKTNDFVSLLDLPTDILCVIFQHISNDNFVSLCKVASVCRKFRKLLLEEPSVRTTLVLPRGLVLCEVMVEILENMNQLNQAVETMQMAQCALDLKTLRAVFPKMKNLVIENADGGLKLFGGRDTELRSLTIRHCIHLGTYELGYLIEVTFPHLEQLTISQVHSSVFYKAPWDFAPQKLSKLSLTDGALTSLGSCFHGCVEMDRRVYADVEELDISDNLLELNDLEAMLSLFENLKVLIMRNFHSFDRFTSNKLDLTHLAQLETFEASNMSGLSFIEIPSQSISQVVIRNSQSLRGLRLGTQSLKYLDLAFCPNLYHIEFNFPIVGDTRHDRLADGTFLSTSCSSSPVSTCRFDTGNRLDSLEFLSLAGCSGILEEELPFIDQEMDHDLVLTMDASSQASNRENGRQVSLTRNPALSENVSFFHVLESAHWLRCLQLDETHVIPAILWYIPKSITSLSVSHCSGLDSQHVAYILNEFPKLMYLDIHGLPSLNPDALASVRKYAQDVNPWLLYVVTSCSSSRSCVNRKRPHQKYQANMNMRTETP